MKSVRFTVPLVLLLSSLAVSQESSPKASKAEMPKHSVLANAGPENDAQKSFAMLKSLAGDWQGPVTVQPPMPQMKGDGDSQLHVSMRVTSRGNAIVHEFQEAGTPLDPSKYDHPVTMLYLDRDRLNLVHYCDAGNRPHMVARTSPDGKTVEFDFVDMTGGNDHGHMYHAVFRILDKNHHTEDWTYMLPGDKPVHAHFELQRAN